jgi:hypothetical protein
LVSEIRIDARKGSVGKERGYWCYVLLLLALACFERELGRKEKAYWHSNVEHPNESVWTRASSFPANLCAEVVTNAYALGDLGVVHHAGNISNKLKSFI